MSPEPLTYGRPVREGYVREKGEERVVWQEHLWNTGARTRTWFVDRFAIREEAIQEREIASAKDQ